MQAIMQSIGNFFEKVKALRRWIFNTGGYLGFPLIVLAILKITQTFTLTLACGVFGMGCDYALSTDKLVAMYAGAMMSLSESEYVPTDKRRASR